MKISACLAAALMLMAGAGTLAKAPTSGPTTAPAQSDLLPQAPDRPGIRLEADNQVNAAWVAFHEEIVKRAQTTGMDVCFIGDSITHLWDGPGRPVWTEKIAPLKAVNFGISGDRTQHVLWRLEHGALDGVKPKVVVILVGINNVGTDEPAKIADGIKAVADTVRRKAPEAKVLVMGLFPMGEKADNPVRAKIKAINEAVPRLSYNYKIWYADIGAKFLSEDGTLSKEIMPDGLHPSAKGYEIWADAILPTIKEMLAQ